MLTPVRVITTGFVVSSFKSVYTNKNEYKISETIVNKNATIIPFTIFIMPLLLFIILVHFPSLLEFYINNIFYNFLIMKYFQNKNKFKFRYFLQKNRNLKK